MRKKYKAWIAALIMLAMILIPAGIAAAGREDPDVPVMCSAEEVTAADSDGVNHTEEPETDLSSEAGEEDKKTESGEDFSGQDPEDKAGEDETASDEMSEESDDSDEPEESGEPEESDEPEASGSDDGDTGNESEEDGSNQEETQEQTSLSADDEVSTDPSSAIKADAGENEEIHVVAEEPVAADGSGSVGIDAEADQGGSYDILVKGSVEACGEQAEAIDAEADNGGSGLINIRGNVKSDGTESQAIDTEAGEDAEVAVNVCGSVEAKGDDATAIAAETKEDGQIRISVTGDVKGSSVGLDASAEDEDSVIHVSVFGTIEGGDYPVLVSGDGIEEALELVVWQIKLDDEGNAVLEKGDEDNPSRSELSMAVEKQIQYIIRYEQPVGGWINLSGTSFADGYYVAHEGETVTMKICVQPGYVLLGAYNGWGQKAALYQDACGNYYIVVPKGGGVCLTADLAYVGIPRPAKTQFEVGLLGNPEELLAFVAQEEEYFAEEGLDVKITVCQNAEELADALKAGEIDAAFMETGSATAMQQDGYEMVIFGGARADESLTTEETVCVVAGAPAFGSSPDTYCAFEKALIRAYRFYQQDPEKAVSDVLKYVPVSEEEVRQAVCGENGFISPDPERLGLENLPDELYDDSVYQKALSELPEE